MNNAWEKINEGLSGILYRMKVPGGWLYRHSTYGPRPDTVMTFVPEPLHVIPLI